MKIAFIGQKGIPAVGGGVERYVEDVATRLAALGHEVIVYTRPNYTPFLLTEYKGVNLVSLSSIPTKHLDAISHTFLATIKAIFSGVDIIHYQSIGPALLSWLPKLLRPKIKVISTLQSRDYEHLKWGGIAQFMLKMGEWCMCRFSDKLIVVTKSMEQYVKEKYNIETSVISNGANLYEEVTTDHNIKSWGLEKNGFIVSISRLIRHKGIDTLISAYNCMNTDKKLVIVGSGAYTDDFVKELHTLAQNNPNIIFTGSQTGEALAELYSQAALFVQPSESEGLSLALLEAMSRRVPVLVSNIPENAEAVRKTGGYVFENKSASDLKEKIEWILAHPEEARTKAQCARHIVEEHYNWDTIVAMIEKMYLDALALNVSSELYIDPTIDHPVVTR
jgi:glycosyltransferase involved in cell wall biosynthesis